MLRTGVGSRMGRHSDSDDDRKRKKKKHKSRSRSSSIDSRTSKTSKQKKSKKKHKHKSKSKSPDRSRSHRKSRSTSREKRVIPKSYRLVSRSPSPYKPKRRSRSRSRTRRRSRSRSRSRTRRSKSPSYSKSRSRRSRSPKRRSRSPRRWSRSPKRRSRSKSPRRRSRSRSPRRRSRSRSRDRSKRERSRSKEKFDAWEKLKMAAAAKAEQKVESEDPCASIPGFESMTLAEQSEARLQMALKAAAAAGEKLKEQGVLSKGLTTNFAEQQQRAWAMDSIENDSFTPAAFRSSHTQGSSTGDSAHENAIFGLSDLTLNTTPSSEQRTKELQAKDTESLMHPNLYISSEDKMTNWIEKLTMMRKRKLEGSAMH